MTTTAAGTPPVPSRVPSAIPPRKPELLGQTVVVIGGSSGIGLETARRARAEGAELILTGRNIQRLEGAAKDVGASRTAAFDATDTASLDRFFAGLPAAVDHVMLTAGRPFYGRVLDMDFAQARRAIDDHLLLVLQVARAAAAKVRPGGSLLFMSGTGGRHPAVGQGVTSALTAALPALTANLALELGPIRVNVIAAGFVDTSLSASLLGDELENRRKQLRDTLPIRSRGRTGGRRRPRRAPHDEHGPHRRDVRRRRRAAVRRAVSPRDGSPRAGHSIDVNPEPAPETARARRAQLAPRHDRRRSRARGGRLVRGHVPAHRTERRARRVRRRHRGRHPPLPRVRSGRLTRRPTASSQGLNCAK